MGQPASKVFLLGPAKDGDLDLGGGWRGGRLGANGRRQIQRGGGHGAPVRGIGVVRARRRADAWASDVGVDRARQRAALGGRAIGSASVVGTRSEPRSRYAAIGGPRRDGWCHRQEDLDGAATSTDATVNAVSDKSRSITAAGCRRGTIGGLWILGPELGAGVPRLMPAVADAGVTSPCTGDPAIKAPVRTAATSSSAASSFTMTI